MATITTRPMTFEEFVQLPEREGLRYELHHGELVEVTFPKLTHAYVQRNLQRLLDKNAGELGEVTLEFGFVTIPDRDYRRGDVVYFLRERWKQRLTEELFYGAPELVVEVLSPSNTMAEMRDKRKLCLSNGAIEFWLVDPAEREVEVYRADRELTTYRRGQQIPLFFAPGSTIDVDAIFA
jgi:Uma2 family endonuclease